MRFYPVFLISALFLAVSLPSVAATAATSGRMPDHSLSVEETMREPSIRHAAPTGDTGFSPNTPIDPNTAKQLQDLKSNDTKDTANLPPFIKKDAKTQSRGYMAQFCSASASSCRDGQRQQACDRFRSSAVNVQQLMDTVVYCETQADNGTEPECDGLDANRVDLLKQYWQDEEMSYTILFLPEMVINASLACAGKKGVDK